MSQQVSDIIEAEVRLPGKKGAARKLRADGRVPAIAYGPSSEPRPLSIDPKVFVAQRQAYGRSHLYNVKVGGAESFKAIIKDIHRDPFSRQLQHVDLYAVDMTKPIRVSVRVDLVGKPKGAIEGGLLTQILRRVEIQGLPDRIPDYLELDVSPLGVGQSAHLSDLKLPEGVKTTAARDEAVAALVEPEGGKATDEGEAGAQAASKS